MTDRLKIGQEVLIHGYVDEIRKDIVIIRNEGGYFGTVEYEITDIEMPNTNDVLDRIRAEIEQNAYPIVHGVNNHEKGMTLYGILQVIDKYKSESEKA